MSFGFGATSQSAFGASQQSLFASNPAQSQPSPFGSTTPATQSAPSLFGAAPQSQSLFGGAPSSASLFGGAPSSASLFGAPAASSASLFGAPAASSASLFGAPAASSASLFGAPASSASLFGAPASSASLFGAPASSASLFAGQQQQQQSAGSLFWNSSSQFQSQPAGFGQVQQPVAQLPRAVTDVIERLNPLHPESKFHAALYNIVSPSDISRYSRPQHMDEKLWDIAVAKNPDPSRLVPVQANLFDDLLVRADMQEKRLKEHMGVMEKIEKELAQIEDHVETDVRTRLAAYRRRHRELARKLLRIASHVELAASRNDASGVLSHTEAECKRRLDNLARALAAPAEFKDKLSDLVELAESTILDRRVHPSVEIRDARAANAIKSLLSDQLAGIEHLENVCERSDRDIGIMAEGVSDR